MNGVFEPRQISDSTLAEQHPKSLQPLLDYISSNIIRRAADVSGRVGEVEVFGPDWCREEPKTAGEWHAEVIVGAYGSTYALPNKDPIANEAALNEGTLDLYLMRVAGELTGTACLVDTGDGRAELGRSASKGNSGNSVIQDLRIHDWLTNPETAEKYHTLFTTLRSAPDRQIDEADGSSFNMRGGQAVTEHWRKFPGLRINGFGPLYLKHGQLEQFSLASLTRGKLDRTRPLHIANPLVTKVVRAWHTQYSPAAPEIISHTRRVPSEPRFEAHYPPAESGLTDLVHADIVEATGLRGGSLVDSLSEATKAGSPFTQVVLPIERNTLDLQKYLAENGYAPFGYEPATDLTSAKLLYGRVALGKTVVPTHWDSIGRANPFWFSTTLSGFASRTARNW